jgi:ElaB/YqjD/DUF883 family membrane-anchored ribosome-binding protein
MKDARSDERWDGVSSRVWTNQERSDMAIYRRPGEQLRERAGQVAEAAGERLEEMRQAGEEYYQKGLRQARELEGNVEHYIREHPVGSLLMAAGIAACLGVLVGSFLRR